MVQTSSRGVAAARLRAVILMAGSIRPTPLVKGAGRSILDLPISPTQTVLHQWQDVIGRLSACAGTTVELRVMVDYASPLPDSGIRTADRPLRVERDPAPLRGTAGVLSDIATDYRDDDVICVAGAAQLVIPSAERQLLQLMESPAVASLLADEQGVPLEFIALRCGILRGVPPVGFLDLKEQVLPIIARDHEVAVLPGDSQLSFPLRTREQYINALRTKYGQQTTQGDLSPAFAERWGTGFHITEVGAHVHASARLHDAVVLCGARVMQGACVVRSVVCPGAVVSPGQIVVDQVVAPAGGRKGDE